MAIPNFTTKGSGQADDQAEDNSQSGPQRSMAVWRQEEIADLPWQLQDLTQVKGVRSKQADKLREAGYEAIPDIHHATPKQIVDEVNGVGWRKVEQVKESASELCNEHFYDYLSEPFMERPQQ